MRQNLFLVGGDYSIYGLIMRAGDLFVTRKSTCECLKINVFTCWEVCVFQVDFKNVNVFNSHARIVKFLKFEINF